MDPGQLHSVVGFVCGCARAYFNFSVFWHSLLSRFQTLDNPFKWPSSGLGLRNCTLDHCFDLLMQGPRFAICHNFYSDQQLVYLCLHLRRLVAFYF